MTSPKLGRKDTKPGRREREKSRLNRLEQPRPIKKEDGEIPVTKRDGAKDAKANIMDRVAAHHNQNPLVVGNAGNGAIWPKIAILKGRFVTNARNRGTSEENV